MVEDSVQLFKKAGVNDWIIHDKQFNKFFTWFSKNITNENILKPIEIGTFTDYQNKDGKIQSGKELDKQLEEINKNYPKIFKTSQHDISRLEHKLEYLVLQEEEYETLAMQMNKTNEELRPVICRTEAAIQNIDLDKIETDCMEKASQVQELQLKNDKLLNDLNQCYTKNQQPPIFIHQMPMEQYYLKCDMFYKQLDVFFKNNFKTQNISGDEDDLSASVMQMQQELDLIKNRLYKSELKTLEQNITNNGLKCLNDVCGNTFLPMSVMAMSLEITKLQNNNETYLKDSLLETMKYLIHESVNQEIEIFILEHNNEKLQKAKKRLEYLRKIMNITSNGLINAELMWILMKFDMEKVKDRKLYEEDDRYWSETRAYVKRMEIMENVLKMPSKFHATVDLFHNEYALCLANHLNLPQFYPDLRTCLIEFNKISISMDFYLDDIIGNKYEQTLEDIFGKINGIEQILHKYVYDGPTCRPNLIHIKCMELLYAKRLENQKNCKKVKEIKGNFVQNYNEPNYNDKLWRQKQLLWIWFLIEPKKLLRAVKEISIKSTAIPTLPVDVTKSISGIKRKQ